MHVWKAPKIDWWTCKVSNAPQGVFKFAHKTWWPPASIHYIVKLSFGILLYWRFKLTSIPFCRLSQLRADSVVSGDALTSYDFSQAIFHEPLLPTSLLIKHSGVIRQSVRFELLQGTWYLFHIIAKDSVRFGSKRRGTKNLQGWHIICGHWKPILVIISCRDAAHSLTVLLSCNLDRSNGFWRL